MNGVGYVYYVSVISKLGQIYQFRGKEHTLGALLYEKMSPNRWVWVMVL